MGMRLFSGGSAAQSSGPIGLASLRATDKPVSGPMAGASLRSAGKDAKPAAQRHPLEPDPARFAIKRLQAVGRALVVQINYPNCVNYEGNKILVYLDVSEATLRSTKDLDPHFLERGLSPVARFEPTERGWGFALGFARQVG